MPKNGYSGADFNHTKDNGSGPCFHGTQDEVVTTKRTVVSIMLLGGLA